MACPTQVPGGAEQLIGALVPDARPSGDSYHEGHGNGHEFNDFGMSGLGNPIVIQTGSSR